jgi:C1A family cysteine protease
MNKVLILTIALLATSTLAADMTERHIFGQFQAFMKTYEKSYTTIEETILRYDIFRMNYEKIYLTNQQLKNNSDYDFELGITEFFDITPEEFAKTHLNLNMSVLNYLEERGNLLEPTYETPAPESFDWREKGVVSSVKNQGSCGSCWAFSAIGNIEGQYAIKTGKIEDFSEQQLLDCDTVDQACNGGLMEDAYKYLETSGVMSDKDYSYHGKKGKCAFDQKKVETKVIGYKYSNKDEEEIKQNLFERGPLAIAMNASLLQFYFGGIFNPWFEWVCNPKGLNHGVLMVGYGVEKNKEYWIVKNSWGSQWGEKGYFRIIRGKGACGVNQYVITAITE